MKKLLSLILSVSLLVTMFVVPAYAVGVYGSAADMIEAVITAATSNVSSPSLSSAISTTKSKITVSGDEVSFDGNVIGYWYSDSSNVLWTDSSKSSIVMQETASGYDALPSTLKTLLTDVNSQLTETYTPTTEDWSKIIGKYDVKLGGKTIPKEQWITMDIQASDDWSNTNNLTNFTSITGKNVSNLGVDLSQRGSDSTETVNIKAWVVDVNGNMYISNGLEVLTQAPPHNGYPAYAYFSIDTLSTQYTTLSALKAVAGSQTFAYANVVPYIKIKLVQGDESHSNYLMPEVFFTDVGNTNALAGIKDNPWNQDDLTLYELRNIADPSEIYSGDLQSIKASGILWLTGAQLGVPTDAYQYHWHSAHTSMFDSFSASKTVRGDSALTKRISKLSSVNAAEPLTIDDNGWYTADGTSIDDFIGSQNVGNAGDTADINAVADVEPMSFNVIVPTTLPVYIDAAGVVSTASNATIVNKSNAAVKLQAINIIAVEDSGWTLVDSSPSTVRDAMEFTFRTSLTADTVLAKDEVLPFTYSTELSPLTDGADSLDLATVQVTVDWAD